MHDRIKALRKELGMTQQAFADKLKISRDNVANYESGRREPTAAALSLICATFHVDETWLRTGEGVMFRPMSRSEELASFFGDVLADEPESFRVRLCSALAELNEEEWQAAERFFRTLTGH